MAHARNQGEISELRRCVFVCVCVYKVEAVRNDNDEAWVPGGKERGEMHGGFRV